MQFFRTFPSAIFLMPLALISIPPAAHAQTSAVMSREEALVESAADFNEPHTAPAQSSEFKAWSAVKPTKSTLPPPGKYNGPPKPANPRGTLLSSPVFQVDKDGTKHLVAPAQPRNLLGLTLDQIKSPLPSADLGVVSANPQDSRDYVKEANERNELFRKTHETPVKNSSLWDTFIRRIYFGQAYEFLPGDEFGAINNSIYFKSGIDGSVTLHKVENLQGSFLGHTQDFLYVKRDNRTILQIDLRDHPDVVGQKLAFEGLPNGYPSFKVEEGDIVGAAVWGNSIYVAVNGQGIIRYQEKNQGVPSQLKRGEVNIVDRAGRISVGANNFAKDGVRALTDFEGTGLICLESSGLYRYGLSTGRTERFASSGAFGLRRDGQLKKIDAELLEVTADRIVVRARYNQISDAVIFVLPISQKYTEDSEKIVFENGVLDAQLRENLLYLTKADHVAVYDINHQTPVRVHEFQIENESSGPVSLRSGQLIGTDFVSTSDKGQVQSTPLSLALLPTEGSVKRCGVRMRDLLVSEPMTELEAQFKAAGEYYASELHRRGTDQRVNLAEPWAVPHTPSGHMTEQRTRARELNEHPNWQPFQAGMEKRIRAQQKLERESLGSRP